MFCYVVQSLFLNLPGYSSPLVSIHVSFRNLPESPPKSRTPPEIPLHKSVKKTLNRLIIDPGVLISSKHVGAVILYLSGKVDILMDWRGSRGLVGFMSATPGIYSLRKQAPSFLKHEYKASPVKPYHAFRILSYVFQSCPLVFMSFTVKTYSWPLARERKDTSEHPTSSRKF